MSIRIVIWNAQGVSNKLTSIRELIRIKRPTMLAFVETHISGEQAQLVCDQIGFSGQLRVEAEAFSGGIWLFWKKKKWLLLRLVAILDT